MAIHHNIRERALGIGFITKNPHGVDCNLANNVKHFSRVFILNAAVILSKMYIKKPVHRFDTPLRTSMF